MRIELDGHMISSIVVQDLQGYYDIMLNNPEEDGICNAIERVLLDYMTKDEYNKWYDGKGIKDDESKIQHQLDGSD